MSGDGNGNGAPKNGNGSIATRIVTDPVIMAIARIMQVIGLPVGAWLFLQVWNGLIEIRSTLNAISTRLAVQEQQVRVLDRDLGLINARLYSLERERMSPAPPGLGPTQGGR